MKITYVKLVNVSSIYTGSKCQTREVEVDFSNSFNKIILLEGPNGCGKTSLLSCLHPFAYNGTLDDRSSEPLIIPHENGYKEIHIQSGVDEYIIKHYYTASGDTHTVKSYMMKNDVELNPNGNVTSFKELVSVELDLEMDFLKLVRLGSNVTNFLELKPTERKTFMGNQLDDTEVYLKFHKKIANDMKLMKMIISRDTDKLSKLNITDINEEEKYLSKLSSSVRKRIEDELNGYRSSLSILKYEMDKSKPIADIQGERRKLKETLSEAEKNASSKRFKGIPDSDQGLGEKLISNKADLDASLSKRAMLISDIDDCESELSDLSIKKRRIDNDEERVSLRNIIGELRRDVDEGDKTYANFKPAYTSSDIEDLLSLLDKLQMTLSTTYEIGEKPIKKVVKLFLDDRDIPAYINNRLDAVYNNKISSSGNDIMTHIKARIKKSQFDGFTCDRECPYKSAYDELVSMTSIARDSSVDSEEFYSYMSLAYSNILAVRTKISENSELFSKMPAVIQSMFETKKFYGHIMKQEYIYDIEVINNELSAVTEYELYLSRKERLEKAISDLERLNRTSGSEFVEDRIKEVLERIASNRDIVKKLNDHIKDVEEVISNLENQSSLTAQYQELMKTIEDATSELDKLSKMLEDQSGREHEYNKTLSLFRDKERELSEVNKQIEGISRRIDEYHRIMAELKQVKEDYDDWEMLRYSLSSKEGIPLIHIDLYLKKTRKIVNDLLDIIYDGSLRILKFDVTADTFKIPYEKEGFRVKDAHLASQGESSFISIALSFALSMQSISKYNIMLLDEIDSTLDQTNREKFIRILEKLMDMIDSEQIFLISHNNMFDMYPVDVINMGSVRGEKSTIKVSLPKST